MLWANTVRKRWGRAQDFEVFFCRVVTFAPENVGFIISVFCVRLFSCKILHRASFTHRRANTVKGPFREGAPDEGGWGRVRYGQLGVLNFVLSMLHNVNLTKHIKYRSSVFQETQAPSTTSWSPSLDGSPRKRVLPSEGGFGKAPSGRGLPTKEGGGERGTSGKGRYIFVRER